MNISKEKTNQFSKIIYFQITHQNLNLQKKNLTVNLFSSFHPSIQSFFLVILVVYSTSYINHAVCSGFKSLYFIRVYCIFYYH